MRVSVTSQEIMTLDLLRLRFGRGRGCQSRSCCCSGVDGLLLCCNSDVVLSLRVQLKGFCGFRNLHVAGAQLKSKSRELF